MEKENENEPKIAQEEEIEEVEIEVSFIRKISSGSLRFSCLKSPPIIEIPKEYGVNEKFRKKNKNFPTHRNRVFK